MVVAVAGVGMMLVAVCIVIVVAACMSSVVAHAVAACLCIVGRNWIALVALVRAQSGKRNECTGCCDIVGGLKNFAGFCADHSSLVDCRLGCRNLSDGLAWNRGVNLVASFAVPPCGRRFVLSALRHARLVVGLLSFGVASFESRLGALSAVASSCTGSCSVSWSCSTTATVFEAFARFFLFSFFSLSSSSLSLESPLLRVSATTTVASGATCTLSFKRRSTCSKGLSDPASKKFHACSSAGLRPRLKV